MVVMGMAVLVIMLVVEIVMLGIMVVLGEGMLVIMVVVFVLGDVLVVSL